MNKRISIEDLKSHIIKPALIVGLGNRLKCDDAAGCLVADILAESGTFDVIDAGTTIENYLGPIIRKKPGTVILVDAVSFEAEPGTYEIVHEGADMPEGWTGYKPVDLKDIKIV